MAPQEKKPDAEPKLPPRVLVMRYSSLGDVALANPVLDGLHAAWPSAQIYFATKKKYAAAVQHHPALTRVIPLAGDGFFSFWDHVSEIRKLNPSLVLDLHDSIRSHLVGTFLRDAKVLAYDSEAVRRRRLVRKTTHEPSLHTIHKYLRILEPLGIKPHLRINFEVHVSKKNQAFIREFAEHRRISPTQMVVGFGPGARWATKQWMPDRFAELASRLVEDYRCILLWFGSKEEIPLIKKIQARMRGSFLERGICLAGEYSLEQSIALLGRCELFISNDSGLAHLASGRGCRDVVIYGSTTTSLGFEPWGPHSVVEVANLDCRPCDPHGKNSCPLGHFKCMQDLTVDLVEGAVKRSMRRSR